MARVSFGHGQPGCPSSCPRGLPPAVGAAGPPPSRGGACLACRWLNLLPVQLVVGPGGHPDPQWMAGSYPPGPASLHRNRLGCSWAQGRAGPIQHLTPVITCLRRVLVTCFRRSTCASRQGPRATFGCVRVDSVSKSGESHGHNLARGALGWAMSLSFTRSCTRPLETEIKSNFGSRLCEMCGDGTQVTGRVGKGIRMLVAPTHPLWTPALPSSPHPGAPLPAQPPTLACRRGGGGSEPSSLNKTQWGPAAHICPERRQWAWRGVWAAPGARQEAGGVALLHGVCPPGSMAACPALSLGTLLCLCRGPALRHIFKGW